MTDIISPLPGERLKPKGFAAITDLDPAVGLTVPKGAYQAVIRATTATVRWRDDGTLPTGTVGFQLLTTEDPLVYQGDLSAIKFFSATGGIEVLFYALTGQ